MTEKQFRRLPPNQQLETIYEHGVMLGKWGEGDEAILLYGLFQFSVEIYFITYRAEPKMIVTYPDLDCQDEHLQYMKVECIHQ